MSATQSKKGGGEGKTPLGYKRSWFHRTYLERRERLKTPPPPPPPPPSSTMDSPSLLFAAAFFVGQAFGGGDDGRARLTQAKSGRRRRGRSLVYVLCANIKRVFRGVRF